MAKLRWEDPKKDYKVLKKKKTIQEEIEGIAVGIPKKKEKSDDVTTEIKKFIEEPIDLERIKFILLRIQGPVSDFLFNNSRIKVFAIFNERRSEYDEFLIKIIRKDWIHTFYLKHGNLIEINMISEKKEWSLLKQEMAHKIRMWLEHNLDQCMKIK